MDFFKFVKFFLNVFKKRKKIIAKKIPFAKRTKAKIKILNVSLNLVPDEKFAKTTKQIKISEATSNLFPNFNL